MSSVTNTGIWLISLDCLNTWIIDDMCNRKCSIRRPRSGPSADDLHAIIEHVKDDTPHRHKNPCEIRAYRPTSRRTRLLSCSKFYTTFLYSFRAIFSNIWL